MRLRPLPAALVLLGFCQSMYAPASLATEVEPIIVTATRTAETADQALAAVTVITRRDIERSQAQSVQDVLRGVPGLALSNNGGAGKATSVFMRGTESDHVLVLIDGIKVGSATLGTTAFQDLPIELIDRIEIVRGPRSSLYGSEAIGGVIQIFTRSGHGPVTPSFSLGAGSFDTYTTSAGASGGNEQGWFSAYLSGTDTQGFNACDGTASGFAGCFTDEFDKDGYRNLSGSLRAGWRFAQDTEAELHWLRTSGDNEFDGSFVNESESTQQVLGGTLRLAPSANWRTSIGVGQSRDESENYLQGSFSSRFDTVRDSASWQNDFTVAAEQLITLGLDWQDDRVDSTTPFAIDSRSVSGLFSQYQGTFGAHDLQVSARTDDNEQFGRYGTGSAAWGYALGNDLRLLASYGTAFKAPTFNELYFPGFGNPTLQPEESASVELGIAGEYAGADWSFNLYETRIDELIGFDASFSPVNIDEARIRGLEWVLGTHWGDWDFGANLSALAPENQSTGANHGNDLPRRAREILHLDVDRGLGRYRLGASFHAESSRYDDLANTRELGGYASLDLRAEYLLDPDWRLQTRVENLFDKDYATAYLYNQPGRGVYLTLRYQPQ